MRTGPRIDIRIHPAGDFTEFRIFEWLAFLIEQDRVGVPSFGFPLHYVIGGPCPEGEEPVPALGKSGRLGGGAFGQLVVAVHLGPLLRGSTEGTLHDEI